MNKKIIYLLIISLIAIIALLFLINYYTKGSLVTGFFFYEEHQSCIQMENGIKQEINQYNLSQHFQLLDDGFTHSSGYYIYSQEFYDIFYSPKINACVDVAIYRVSKQVGSGLEIIEETYEVDNATSSASIDWQDTIKHGYPYLGMTDITKLIDQYR